MTTTKCKKKRVTKAQKEMAYRYRCAYNFLFSKKPPALQKYIVEEPQGRMAKELAHDVAKLAESDAKIPDMNND